MAEGILKYEIEKRGLADQLACDSAGLIGYHAGDLPDKRMRKTALNHGIKLTHKSRKFTMQDFQDFQYILAMDDSNIWELRTLERRQNNAYYLGKLREFDNKKSGDDVQDPYYYDDEAFETCFQVLKECVDNLLNFLIENGQVKPKTV
jgi:protein-tyrosine phosphatase